MSRLIALQERLQHTNTAISRAERAIVEHPDIPSAAATLRGFLKMRESLQEQFLEEADRLELDACSYKITPEGGRPTVSSLTAVLGSFQNLFTVVYDAVVNGPKQIAKIADNIEEAAALGFAYSFPGSIGFMLTLENKRFLIGDTPLESAMGGVFELMQVTTTDEASQATRKWGIAALRTAHKWAQSNAQAGFGADITWLRRNRPAVHIRLQEPEVTRLAKTISQTTEISENEYVGEISMVDWDAKTFRMKSEGVELVGQFSESAIDTTQPVSVPGFYRVLIRVARPLITEGDVSPSYTLLVAVPLSGDP